MAVPTTGSFDMFGTGSITSIQGAMKDTGDIVDGLTQFNQLISSSTYYKFDYDYAGEITNPAVDINQSYQFRGYPVDPGNCRAVWVSDSVDSTRYGARYRLPSNQLINIPYGSLFGTPYNYSGVDGTVYNLCSTLAPVTIDTANSNVQVDLGSNVVNFTDGGTCYINTDCEWIPPSPTPTGTGTPTPTPTNTPTKTPTPTPTTIYYYYQLAHCTDGPSNSIYVYRPGSTLTNGDAFTYFSNCYEYYDVDPGQTGIINVDTLTPCVCPTPTSTPTNTPTPTVTPTKTPTPTPSNTPIYYYQLQSCNSPGNFVYGYSFSPSLVGLGKIYFSNCYEVYDVDPGKTGTINLDTLTSCACPTPTPTPTNTSTPTVTPTSTFIPAPSPTGTPTNTPTPTSTNTVKYCQFMRVDNTVDQNRYGLRWNNGGDQTATFSTLLGTSDGTDTVFGVCSNIVPLTWDSVTNTNVSLAGVTFDSSGGVCINDFECTYTVTPTPTPTPTKTPTPTPVTPTPTPTPACPTYLLGDASTTGQDACNDYYSTPTLRHLNNDFLAATVIYANSSCTGTAPIGYYSDGNIWRYWNGSSFTTSATCVIY